MIGNFYHLAIVVGLALSLTTIGKRQGKELLIQKVIVVILFIVLIMELTGFYTASKGINNSLLYNIGWIHIESILLVYYLILLEVNRFFKKKIVWIVIGILAWGIVNSLFFQSINSEFQYFTFLPFALLIIILVIRFWTHLMQMKTYSDKELINLPHFWISWGILLFYIEALLLFGTYQFHPVFVVNHVKLLFTINQFAAGLMYLVFGLAFMLPRLYKGRLFFLVKISNK